MNYWISGSQFTQLRYYHTNKDCRTIGDSEPRERTKEWVERHDLDKCCLCENGVTQGDSDYSYYKAAKNAQP